MEGLNHGISCKQILKFDTSIMSENLVDQIVMEYCNKYLREMFLKDFIISSLSVRQLMEKSVHVLVVITSTWTTQQYAELIY